MLNLIQHFLALVDEFNFELMVLPSSLQTVLHLLPVGTPGVAAQTWCFCWMWFVALSLEIALAGKFALSQLVSPIRE